MPAVQMPRVARVGTAEEFANQPEGTAMLVNGRPVAQRQIDELVAYLGSAPGGGDAAMQQQRALFDLIRIEAVASSFDEAQAETEDRVGQGRQVPQVAASGAHRYVPHQAAGPVVGLVVAGDGVLGVDVVEVLDGR
jgi:hypothetical protein